MEARAVKKYIRSSPRKMRLVIDLIRGKNAAEALTILQFSPKLASNDALNVLKSAVSNLQNKAENARVNVDKIFVKEAFVNQGATLRRVLPAPMGRAYRVRKRSHHLTIVVSTKD